MMKARNSTESAFDDNDYFTIIMMTIFTSTEFITDELDLRTVQAEWDTTLHQLRSSFTVVDASTVVKRGHYARLTLHKAGLDIEAAERILFENRLLALWSRTEDHDVYHFGGEWLWRWRAPVPWLVEPIGPMNRLAPKAPRHQWTYRFHLIEAEP